MAYQRLWGVAAGLSLATACVPAANQNALAPQRGPEARVYASFTGGITNRSAHARFAVQSDAFVMVGHLGGDGYVRILYPSSANERGLVRKGKSYTTRNVPAYQDAIPALYNARTVRYRHVAARLDSYDGAGNGYFFIVASRYPLDFAEISEGGFFDEIEVPDYYDTYDPRLTVKALADLVSGGSPYTLDFASSFASVDYSSSFDQRLDCMTLSIASLGFASYSLWTQPYYYAFGTGSLRNVFGRNGCANPYSYASYYNPRYYANTYVPTLSPPLPQPRGTIRPPWQRRVTPPRRSGVSASSAYLPDRINQRREANGAMDRAGARARARDYHDRARTHAAAATAREASQPRSASPSASGSSRASDAATSSPRSAGGESRSTPTTERKRDP